MKNGCGARPDHGGRVRGGGSSASTRHGRRQNGDPHPEMHEHHMQWRLGLVSGRDERDPAVQRVDQWNLWYHHHGHCRPARYGGHGHHGHQLWAARMRHEPDRVLLSGQRHQLHLEARHPARRVLQLRLQGQLQYEELTAARKQTRRRACAGLLRSPPGPGDLLRAGLTPLLAKPAQDVQHRRWPAADRSERPPEYASVQARWCRLWVSAEPPDP
jgi:hypothetical protein